LSADYFYSNGKLLITGEYLVLKGALALAVPLRFGQSLEISYSDNSLISWESYDTTGLWFKADFTFPDLKIIQSSDSAVAGKLRSILRSITEIKPSAFDDLTGLRIRTAASFKRVWGLGTSSTLINNIARWLDISPYELLWKNFKGSAYDIACTRAKGPIFYQLKELLPEIQNVKFAPPFRDRIFFIYSGEKQDTQEAIQSFDHSSKEVMIKTKMIAPITRELASVVDMERFIDLIKEHERIIGDVVQTKPVGESKFHDFNGAVKSLGAWGGDFLLAVAPDGYQYTKEYFSSYGLKTIFPFEEIVLSPGSAPFPLDQAPQ